MKRVQLSQDEKSIEQGLIQGEFIDVDRFEFDKIARAIASRKKDAVLNIRINRDDLDNLKSKAKKYGIKYQTFVAELIHRVAQT